MHETIPYGAWPSPISARSVVAGVVGFSELTSAAGMRFWLESRPEENGRSVLVRCDADGLQQDVTPAPCNVRSRVHEYGGGAYTVAGDGVWFVNFDDQNLYRERAGTIEQITRSPVEERFADFRHDSQHQRLISVVERHSGDAEPQNLLGAVDAATGAVTVLDAQHDFYASPRLAPDGRRLAFVAWDHPNMPWDGSVLYLADVLEDGSLGPVTQLAGGADESITQPVWLSDDALLFLSDANGFWNLYRFDASGTFCVLEDGADYGQPAWVFGMQDYAVVDAEHVVALRRADTGQELVLINTRTGMATPLGDDPDGAWTYEHLAADEGRVFHICGFPDRLPEVCSTRLSDLDRQVIAAASGGSVAPSCISAAQPLRFPTRDGQHAFANFYAPKSTEAEGPPEARPPLLVMSHGGPTSAAESALSLRIQFYTSRGWAVLDVNYRGSSGFGRAYRTALNGQWGVLDVCDCEDGVRHLVQRGLVDPERVAIRGGSAGGYTTLAALTSTSTFRCGASHYGIGDLNALASDTHKFESRYLQTLLGDDDALDARSPINHIDRLDCPVIFFQGGRDEVVPPNQAEAMVAALERKGIAVAYRLFPEEGHGFRSAGNIVEALESEHAFFCLIFGIHTSAATSLDIRNPPESST